MKTLKTKPVTREPAYIPVDLGIRVSVTCCYCHDGMERAEAAFCARCLAPHHPDCFDVHGECATPGCGSVEVVYPNVRPVARRWPAAAAVAVALLAAAAWLVGAPSARVAPAAAETLAAAAPQAGGYEAPPLLRLSDDDAPFEVPAGTIEVGELTARWARAQGKTLSVDPQLDGVEVTLGAVKGLDREGLRALLEPKDAVLVVRQGAAELWSRRNLATHVGNPVLVHGDAPVDPDAFVSRVIPLRAGNGGNAIFATIRGLLTRDVNRIGNILYTPDTSLLTLVDLARNVRHYEEIVEQLDRPGADMKRVHVELFAAARADWDGLRDVEPRAALARLRGAAETLESTDLDLRDGASAGLLVLRRAVGGVDVALSIVVDLRPTWSRAISLCVELRRDDEVSGTLRCPLPLDDDGVRTQAKLLPDGRYLVFVVSHAPAAR